MRKFDLNIEKILENWNTHHAIREIISNAMDEQMLTKTKSIQISKKGNVWLIRDFGRGLQYTHLTQKENREKLSNPNVIGKFGIGLKDALATFDRKRIKILIRSKHGDITLNKSSKEGFSDIKTLHAIIDEPSDKKMSGTEFILEGVTDDEIEKAKNLFLFFSGEEILENTSAGQVIRPKNDSASIYINGVKVAEEANFLFSYNITTITEPIRKALNRERSNVGRTAYTDTVKRILTSSKSQIVAELLADDLSNLNRGTAHDELSWLDVQVHAVKILNPTGNYLFATSSDIMRFPDMLDEAKQNKYIVITIPENLKSRIGGLKDFEGNKVVDINQFVRQYSDSFQFKIIKPEKLTEKEKKVFNYTIDILNLIGGKPKAVKEILISSTMRKDFFGQAETLGVWEGNSGRIIILRKTLNSIREYAGTLIHEALHAKYGAGDVSRFFESVLTEAIGQISEKALKDKQPSSKVK